MKTYPQLPPMREPELIGQRPVDPPAVKEPNFGVAQDFAIDLETISNDTNSAMVAVTVYHFDRNTLELLGFITVEVLLVSAMRYGTANASTIAFWMKQNDEARRIFNSTQGEHLAPALTTISEWIQGRCERKWAKLWGNGSTFDNTILRNAYIAVGIQEPWDFWNDRDLRTLLDIFNWVTGRKPKHEVEFEGNPHDSADDCKHQTRLILESLKGFKELVGNKTTNDYNGQTTHDAVTNFNTDGTRGNTEPEVEKTDEETKKLLEQINKEATESVEQEPTVEQVSNIEATSVSSW